MNPTKSFLGCQVAYSSNSSSHPKGFISILTKSKPFRICNLQRPSKNLEVYKADLPASENSLQIFRVIVNLYKIIEKRCLIHLVWHLSGSFWEYQRVPHQASGPSSSHFGKIILALCKGHGSFLRCPTCTKEWWRLRISHLLPELNFDWGWMLLQSNWERMSSYCLRGPKDARLLDRKNNSCHL